jgi:urease accessory protein
LTAREQQAATLHLLAWLSPAFPVGAFAYSHGLEAAVDSGDIADAETLRAWLSDLIGHGTARTDSVLAAAAYAAAEAKDAEALREINALALALSPARERRLETATMGTAFCGAIRAAWGEASAALLPERDVAYPVAFGAACAAQGLARMACLEGFALAFVQNLVSAAVRLGPIGQTDGQRVTAALLPAVRTLAAFAAGSTLDDVGGCAFRSDIAAMRHETLYSRLFRS